MKEDFLIVGSGLFGAVCARELTDRGYKCLVIDKRNHIGGNCYTQKILDVNVSLYGGHYFHTNNKCIWDYVNKFEKFIPYEFVAKTHFQNKIYSFPVNLLTLHQLWGIRTPQEAKKKIKQVRIDIENPQNFEEKMLSLVGEEIYYTFFYGYNKKHWKCEPRELPTSLANRIFIRYDYNDKYFSDLFQGMPDGGYTSLFEKMMDGIDVRLNEEFDNKTKYNKLIYTGPIDEFFDYKLGKLDYIGVRYEYTDEEIGSAMITEPNYNIPYIRKFSYSYSYPWILNNNFVTAVEYPSYDKNDQFYPVGNEKSISLYDKYIEKTPDNVYFKGRLGNYRYWNMDVTIKNALEFVKEITE
jgi:UDP-galactopyranose mutase